MSLRNSRPLLMTPASAWTPSTVAPVCTPPGTAVRGQTTRAAHFTCAIACAFPNGDTITAEGQAPGTIAFAPMGEGGFGYDPVFFVPDKAKTFAQLTQEEKAEISHRGKALREFTGKLETYLKENPSIK